MGKKGFTLIEAIMAVSIFVFMMIGLYGTLSTGNNIYTSDSILLDLKQQALKAMDKLVRELRESNSSTITVVDSNSDTLVFSTPNESNIRYYRSGTNFIREYPSGTTRIIAVNIARFKCTKTGTLMKIDIRADKVWASKTFTFPLLDKVRLRNE